MLKGFSEEVRQLLEVIGIKKNHTERKINFFEGTRIKCTDEALGNRIWWWSNCDTSVFEKLLEKIGIGLPVELKEIGESKISCGEQGYICLISPSPLITASSTYQIYFHASSGKSVSYTVDFKTLELKPELFEIGYLTVFYHTRNNWYREGSYVITNGNVRFEIKIDFTQKTNFKYPKLEEYLSKTNPEIYTIADLYKKIQEYHHTSDKVIIKKLVGGEEVLKATIKNGECLYYELYELRMHYREHYKISVTTNDYFYECFKDKIFYEKGVFHIHIEDYNTNRRLYKRVCKRVAELRASAKEMNI